MKELVRSHARFLSFVEKRLGSREAAEDVLQAAYAKALTKEEELREGERVAAWFYRILRNAIVDHYRRTGAHAKALDGYAREPRDDGGELEREVCACVGELLDDMKPEYQGILRAGEIDELPLEEIAKREKITANNAGVRLHRAREALKKRVVQTCGTCAKHGCVDCTCKH